LLIAACIWHAVDVLFLLALHCPALPRSARVLQRAPVQKAAPLANGVRLMMLNNNVIATRSALDQNWREKPGGLAEGQSTLSMMASKRLHRRI
jgi:hypothetical protein